MAMLTQEVVSSAGGMLTGAGGTLALRERVDRSGDDAYTRPSVIYGIGTGLVGLSLQLLNQTRRLTLPRYAMPAVESHATSALVAGVFSALYPKGSVSAVLPAGASFLTGR